ncbi:amidohydrolase family protein, partial [Streptosporangium canum]|uniref:amidohydrolase family protein n=1 Tax=Streptosporangium canum TaxID=324952 RepID=UPI00343FDAB5
LVAMIDAAHAAGHQIGVHATGSRTTRKVADAFGAARSRDGRDARHYVIHGDVISPATLAAMAAARVGLNTQAGIAVATEDMLRDALGEDVLARASTATPAWQDGAEDWKGSLEQGKVADLCVLEASLLETEAESLPQVPVALTMVGGRVVHEL